MPVYMIRAGETGPVKIGHSADPEMRLMQLQISHWERLRIIRMFEGGPEEEAKLHKVFADLYIRGEWHSFSHSMMGDLGLVEFHLTPPDELPSLEKAAVIPIGDRIALARKHAKLSQRELALALGVSHGAVGKWEAFGTGIQAHRLPLLASLLGVSVDWLFAGVAASELAA